MNEKLTIRQATAEDAEITVPLIHSSGPDAFNYVFSSTEKLQSIVFLNHCFVKGTGQFGFKNHYVAEIDGEVVGCFTLYSGKDLIGYTLNSVIRILSFYGLINGLKVMFKGLKTETVIRPPSSKVRYIAHVAVDEKVRGKGIGSKIIAFAEELTKRQRVKAIALDVAVTNSNAHLLYQRKGFVDKALRISQLVSLHGSVPDHIYMEKVF